MGFPDRFERSNPTGIPPVVSFRFWLERQDSNLQHTRSKPVALPIELPSNGGGQVSVRRFPLMRSIWFGATRTRFQPM